MILSLKMYSVVDRQKTKKVKHKKALLIGCVVALLVLVVVILEVTDTTHFFHKKNPIVKHDNTASQNTKGEPSKTSAQEDGSSSTSPSQQSTSTDKNDKSAAPSTTPLSTPTGTFVSNHRPNLSGSPAPNTITSDCTTTPGAICTIQLTNSATGESKSLPPQSTDRGGSAYWSWKLQDIGITQGSWQVKAKATLGDQTKTATDAMNLEVQQ